MQMRTCHVCICQPSSPFHLSFTSKLSYLSSLIYKDAQRKIKVAGARSVSPSTTGDLWNKPTALRVVVTEYTRVLNRDKLFRRFFFPSGTKSKRKNLKEVKRAPALRSSSVIVTKSVCGVPPVQRPTVRTIFCSCSSDL